MINTITEFEYHWTQELEATQKLFKHLTDKSLTQSVGRDGRTLGRMAWHITTTISEMMSLTGLTIDGPKPDDPVPSSAKLIYKAYYDASISLLNEVKSKWSDASLQEKDNMYGEMWKRSETLVVLIFHQIHHRGQMTVLMRQAGLEIPGLYGPARQEWATYGKNPPEV